MASPDVGLAYLVVMALLIAVYLPCYFRWGYGAAGCGRVLLAGLVIAGDAEAARWAPRRRASKRAGGTADRPRWSVGDSLWRRLPASPVAPAAGASAALAARGYRGRQF